MSISNNKILKLGIIMDPLESLNIKKDSTYAMINEASARNWEIYCCTPHDIFVANSVPCGIFKKITYKHNTPDWFSIDSTQDINLNSLDIILLRKDPPFDMEYIYATYILDIVQSRGTLVANNPTSIRSNNEKLATLNFPEVTPPNLVTAHKNKLLAFIAQHQTVIVKPLDGMGGRSIFKVKHGDDNTSVILDTITSYGTKTILAQKFIPEIKDGDKRVLLINGEAIPYGLARVPAEGEFRGNLAAGASGVGFELSLRDKYICNNISPYLKQHGLSFVGIDIIGEYLTEINVTSPTCIQELDQQFDLNISKTYLDYLADSC
jgi:glutathione synthase